MIVVDEFPGDDFELLKHVQHDCYFAKVVDLYGEARKRYQTACALLEVHTDLLDRIAKPGFDHRTLQSTHDLIAAWFRFRRGGELRQMGLGESQEELRRRLLQEWGRYFDEEIADRMDEDVEFTRAILTAVEFANTEPGYAAEEWLEHRLRCWYGPMGGPPIDEAL